MLEPSLLFAIISLLVQSPAVYRHVIIEPPLHALVKGPKNGGVLLVKRTAPPEQWLTLAGSSHLSLSYCKFLSGALTFHSTTSLKRQFLFSLLKSLCTDLRNTLIFSMSTNTGVHLQIIFFLRLFGSARRRLVNDGRGRLYEIMLG